jgi:1-acyl-sn-glycerol-3-phosphate acyltransferase
MKYLVALILLPLAVIYLLIIAGLTLLMTVFMPVSKVDPCIKYLFKILFKILFTPVSIENIEVVDKSKSYIFMPNHVSFLDPFLLQAYIPNFMRGIEKESHFHWPLYGYYIKVFGNIPIKQSSVQSSLQSFKKAHEYLSSGKSVTLFPEGHRTETGQLQNFKRLPFLLAKEAKVDIIPIGLSGLYRMLPINSWVIRPTHLKVKFGKVITAAEVEKMEVNELLERVRNEISNLIEHP